MKKILALILLTLMLFTTACSTSGSAGTDTDTNSTAQSDSNTDNKDTSSGNESYNPDITEDYTKYNPTYNAAKTKINYGKETLNAPELSKFYNNYEAAISMTFDDGDHLDTGRTLNELFEKYGFRGTLMFTANNVKGTADEWNEILSKGYLDVGCHGYHHVGPTSISDEATLTRETKEAVELLRELFPTQKVLTFATPLANITDEYEAAIRELVIANRLEQFGNKVVYGGDYNMYRIQASSFNEGKTIDYINSQANDAVKSGAWLVELMHGVVDGKRYNTFPAVRADKLVDPTSAGDAFTGALTLEYLRNGGDIKAAIKYGNVAAAITVTRPGATSSIPTEEEINAFLSGTNQ